MLQWMKDLGSTNMTVYHLSIKAETNIKEIELVPANNDFIKKRAKANFKTLGKKLGSKMKWAAERIQQLEDAEINKIQEGDYLLNPDYQQKKSDPRSEEHTSE